MNAQTIAIDPADEATYEIGQSCKREFGEALIKISEGCMSLEVIDISAAEVEKAKKNKKREDSNRRQKEFKQRKHESGFTREWMHSTVKELVGKIDEQETFARKYKKLLARAEEAEKIAGFERTRANAAEAEILRLNARSWWRFWR